MLSARGADLHPPQKRRKRVHRHGGSRPEIAPSHAASVITDILAGLAQAQPAIFAVSRAGVRTQAQVSLGLGLAEIIVGAFLRRPT